MNVGVVIKSYGLVIIISDRIIYAVRRCVTVAWVYVTS